MRPPCSFAVCVVIFLRLGEMAMRLASVSPTSACVASGARKGLAIFREEEGAAALGSVISRFSRLVRSMGPGDGSWAMSACAEESVVVLG